MSEDFTALLLGLNAEVLVAAVAACVEAGAKFTRAGFNRVAIIDEVKCPEPALKVIRRFEPFVAWQLPIPGVEMSKHGVAQCSECGERIVTDSEKSCILTPGCKGKYRTYNLFPRGKGVARPPRKKAT